MIQMRSNTFLVKRKCQSTRRYQWNTRSQKQMQELVSTNRGFRCFSVKKAWINSTSPCELANISVESRLNDTEQRKQSL